MRIADFDFWFYQSTYVSILVFSFAEIREQNGGNLNFLGGHNSNSCPRWIQKASKADMEC